MRLSEAAKMLSESGIENARHDARTLFKKIGQISELDLIGKDPESNSEKLKTAIERRCAREPLQYIIGEVDFYRETYKVSKDCLIPREDTEILVDFAVKSLPKGARFLDLCTGSGCIAISTLKNTMNTEAVAVDISEEALSIARENAEKNGVAERLTFICSDILNKKTSGEYFAILSNPPYVTRYAYEHLEPEIYSEPKSAFVADDNGLIFYKRITEDYKDSISSGGFLAFEIGFDQGDALKQIAASHGLGIEIIKDYSGNDRVAVMKK